MVIQKSICANPQCKKEFVRRGPNHKFCAKPCTLKTWYGLNLQSVLLEEKKQRVLVKRICLGCGNMFRSEGIHNRMCKACNRKEDVYGPSQENYNFGSR